MYIRHCLLVLLYNFRIGIFLLLSLSLKIAMRFLGVLVLRKICDNLYIGFIFTLDIKFYIITTASHHFAINQLSTQQEKRYWRLWGVQDHSEYVVELQSITKYAEMKVSPILYINIRPGWSLALRKKKDDAILLQIWHSPNDTNINSLI